MKVEKLSKERLGTKVLFPLLIEKNRQGTIWLHFAVRPKENRRKIDFLKA